MLTFFSPHQRLHAPTKELHRGGFVAPFESPDRIDRIVDAVLDAGLGDVVTPPDDGIEPLARVHDRDYLHFLSTIYDNWNESGGEEEIVPHVWPGRTLRELKPTSIYGLVGYYSFDAGTTIVRGTWEAAYHSAQSAAAAAAHTGKTGELSFALCRPPGHHAAADLFGGYCFLNNAAIAAEQLLAGQAERVAILDVDYHHGNGGQSIFYQRNDVLFVSIHADPAIAYPYFAGAADEIGEGEGRSFNLNLPLPDGVDWRAYEAALSVALQRIDRFQCDALVVSLGVDTFAGDPISTFRLKTDDFRLLGERIARCNAPTVVVLEGGYAVDALGRNVVNTLMGLQPG